MSMGGAYIRISNSALNSIIETEGSLSDYVFDEANVPSDDIYTLEQAWDAVRVLLIDDVPDVLGSDVLEGVDLGEECYLIEPNDTLKMIQNLEKLTPDKIEELRNSDNFQNEDFYWADTWREDENFEEIVGYVTKLSEFLKSALKDNKVVLFYIA